MSRLPRGRRPQGEGSGRGPFRRSWPRMLALRARRMRELGRGRECDIGSVCLPRHEERQTAVQNPVSTDTRRLIGAILSLPLVKHAAPGGLTRVGYLLGLCLAL